MLTRFEWDTEKAASNLRKHGVHFETAMRVFADPFALSACDHGETGEVRWRTLGAVDGCVLLLVVHTAREETKDGRYIEVIRIISARAADRKERQRYEQESRR